MTDLVLRTVFEPRAHTRAIEDGSISIPGVAFDFVRVSHITKAMAAVADRLEFDLGEITMIDYMLARRFGRPLQALPLFVNRGFMRDRVMYHVRSGIRGPKDLEGKRVGLKSYTQTGPVWNRGILAMDYGVDIDRITWVNVEGPHVGEYRNPPNVVPAPPGKNLAELLESGDIDAADDPGRPWADRGEKWHYDTSVIRKLIAQGQEDDANWYRRAGICPILHVLVVKADAIRARPGLAQELFEAFVEAKRVCMNGPSDQAGRVFPPEMATLPYGVGPNAAAIDMLCEFAFRQGIAPVRYQAEDLFDPGLMRLEG